MAKHTPNTHRVPVRAWRKWNDHERHVFNALYSSMKGNQIIFLHPKQEKLSAQKWATVAWNAAWIAADAAREYRKQTLPVPTTVNDYDRKGNVVRTHVSATLMPLH